MDPVAGREQLLTDIVAIEELMFITVKAAAPSACQQRLHAFRAMRRICHDLWSDETLVSYLADLRGAGDRNFFSEKYLRIGNQIPPLNDSELIEEVIAVESSWLADVRRRFPRLVQSTGVFEIYERAELETYSDNTLALVAKDVLAARDQGRNLVEERYRHLYNRLGLGALEEVEERDREPKGTSCTTM